MPVGRVYNAAANQVLFSPVTNYYQGKAIRQQLEEGELDIELKKQEVQELEELFQELLHQQEKLLQLSFNKEN